MKDCAGVLRTPTVLIERRPLAYLVRATANGNLDIYWSTVAYAARVVKFEFFWLVFSHRVILHSKSARRETARSDHWHTFLMNHFIEWIRYAPLY